MKVRIIKRVPGMRFKIGEEAAVSVPFARTLIKKGLAEELTATPIEVPAKVTPKKVVKPRKKKTDTDNPPSDNG